MAPAPSSSIRSFRLPFAAIALAALAAASLAAEDEKQLLDTTKTIIGRQITYPAGTAKVSASIITLKPGDERGWHEHQVPLFGYVLDGELTIDFGKLGTKVFRKGDAFVEALNTAHNGRNLGKEDVRLLAVFMGAEGVKDTVRLPPPQ
jgi:quercetin dioxygenase-like cupin family protein